jgi:hypothetical protein
VGTVRGSVVHNVVAVTSHDPRSGSPLRGFPLPASGVPFQEHGGGIHATERIKRLSRGDTDTARAPAARRKSPLRTARGARRLRSRAGGGERDLPTRAVKGGCRRRGQRGEPSEAGAGVPRWAARGVRDLANSEWIPSRDDGGSISSTVSWYSSGHRRRGLFHTATNLNQKRESGAPDTLEAPDLSRGPFKDSNHDPLIKSPTQELRTPLYGEVGVRDSEGW